MITIFSNALAKIADIFGRSDQPTHIEKSFKIRRPDKEKLKPIYGYREDLGLVMRSKMEANVYRYYKYKEKRYGKIRVHYEPELFTFPLDVARKFGINGYVPDIKVVNKTSTHYIEVKGKMSDTDTKKAELMATYYPRIKILYIFPEEYNKIQRLYSHKIKNWE